MRYVWSWDSIQNTQEYATIFFLYDDVVYPGSMAPNFFHGLGLLPIWEGCAGGFEEYISAGALNKRMAIRVGRIDDSAAKGDARCSAVAAPTYPRNRQIWKIFKHFPNAFSFCFLFMTIRVSDSSTLRCMNAWIETCICKTIGSQIYISLFRVWVPQRYRYASTELACCGKERSRITVL